LHKPTGEFGGRRPCARKAFSLDGSFSGAHAGQRYGVTIRTQCAFCDRPVLRELDTRPYVEDKWIIHADASAFDFTISDGAFGSRKTEGAPVLLNVYRPGPAHRRRFTLSGDRARHGDVLGEIPRSSDFGAVCYVVAAGITTSEERYGE
jgi:hypothetical protein